MKAHFATREAALEDWLATGWYYGHPEPGEVSADWDAAEALLTECAFVVDRKACRARAHLSVA